MSGADMLIKNLLSAAGIDPEKVKNEVQEFGRQLAAKIASMDKSLEELKAQQTLTYEMIVNLSLKLQAQAQAKASDLAVSTVAAPNGGMPRAKR